MAGLTVAQISEFSLILVALGVSLGHISAEVTGLVTLVGIITIFASTYMIIYSEKLYLLLSKPLKLFERKNPYREPLSGEIAEIKDLDFILIGLGNYGRNIGKQLLKRQKVFMGLDFSPAVLEQWHQHKVPVMYGDITDPELYEQLPLSKAKWVVSTIRSKDISQMIFRQLKHYGYTGKIALTATDVRDASSLEKMGVHVVLRPFRDASEQAVDTLTHAMAQLPQNLDWPVAFKEIRIEPTSIYVDRALKDIPLRHLTGVSILAVSRAGKINYDLDAEFKLYPADRLLIMGPPEKIRDAEDLLGQVDLDETVQDAAHFGIGHFKFRYCPEGICQSLSMLGFRQRYGVTVIGIERGEERITYPQANEVIRQTDQLVLIGTAEALQKLSENEDLLEISQEVAIQVS